MGLWISRLTEATVVIKDRLYSIEVYLADVAICAFMAGIRKGRSLLLRMERDR